MSIWKKAQQQSMKALEAHIRKAPGGPDAVAQGCTCPVHDNRCGLGRPYVHDATLYTVATNCPLHSEEFTLRMRNAVAAATALVKRNADVRAVLGGTPEPEGDPYTLAASVLYEVPDSEVTDEMRETAKRRLFEAQMGYARVFPFAAELREALEKERA